MITIIAGSREIRDYYEVCRAVELSDFNITGIVSGGARGVDKMGERYARSNNIPLKVMPAEWDSFGISAGHMRNTEMAKQAQALIAIYNFRSPGTKHMIKIALRKRLKVHIHAHDAMVEMYSDDFRYILRFSVIRCRFFVTVVDCEADFHESFSIELGYFALNKIKNWSNWLNNINIESLMANDASARTLIKLAFVGNTPDNFYCEVKFPQLEGSHKFTLNLNGRVYRRRRKRFEEVIEQLRCMVQTCLLFLDKGID